MEPEQQPPDFLSINEAARRLGVNPKTARKLVETGELPAVRLGERLIRIPTDAVSRVGVPMAPAASK
jgi:excisionase family DNA binding protein